MTLINFGGIVYRRHPLTHEAHEWITDHLPADALRLGNAVATEWRYFEEVAGSAAANSPRVH
jgi:hypothetical protein